VLSLSLSPQPGRASISCDGEHTSSLSDIRARFATATALTPLSFELDIDDLLVNVYELAAWPGDDTDVTWDPDLLALVEGNIADSELAGERLHSEAAPASYDPATLMGGWHAPLTDFQCRDLGKLLELRHAANFSVPGAGKTRVTLAAFQARRDASEIQRMLVVAPKSAFESWTLELEECFNGERPVLSVAGDTPVSPDATIGLTNYERLPGMFPGLVRWLQQQPAMLVLDEAHRMKLGAAGVWGAACLALAPYARRRMILTGTPAPNGARDLENLFGFVWPGQGRRIVNSAVAGGDLRAASQRLRPLFARTTKHELGLPPVKRTVRRIPLPPLHREIYDALSGQIAARWESESKDVTALGRIMVYLLMAATTPALLATGATPNEPLPYRVPPLEPPPGTSLASLMKDLPNYELSPKYQEVMAIVAKNSAAGRKTLIWSTFVRNLTSLAHLLANYSPAVVHGGTVDREAELERFRSDPACKVLLSNPATLGEGVSLHHACNDAVYVDRDFAAGRYMQSLDRIHRLGLAADTVTRVTILVADHTLDELVEQRLAVKLDFLGRILDDPAVLELGDLEEEITETASMNEQDLAGLEQYLRGVAST
jgi:SNF2 family DNA or RNA helicase